MITLENVNISVAGKEFLSEVNFSITRGEIVRLVGTNGGGKSTLIEVLLGLRAEYDGFIARKFIQEDYGFLPQVAHQFPKIYLKFSDICDQSYSFYPATLFNKSWHTSSGGERKKALIAKALHEAKSLVVLDEPFNHLDHQSCTQVTELLCAMAKEGMTIIYTGHEHTIPGGRDIEVEQWRS